MPKCHSYILRVTRSRLFRDIWHFDIIQTFSYLTGIFHYNYLVVIVTQPSGPLCSNRPAHRALPECPYGQSATVSYGDCLEVRGEIIRTVLCCIVYWKLCTVISRFMLDEQFLQFSGLGFVSLGTFHFTVPRFICVVFVFILSYCRPICVVLLYHGGVDLVRLKPKILEHLPSVLWHCWLGHLTRKKPSPTWPIMCSVGR